MDNVSEFKKHLLTVSTHHRKYIKTFITNPRYLPRNGRIQEQDERNGFVGMPLSAPSWMVSNLHIKK